MYSYNFILIYEFSPSVSPWQVKLSVFEAMINSSICYGILGKIRLSALRKLRSTQCKCVYFHSLVVINTVLHYEFMCGQAKVFCFELPNLARKMRAHSTQRCVVCIVYSYIDIEMEQLIQQWHYNRPKWWKQNIFEYQLYCNRHVHTNAHFQRLWTVAQFPKNPYTSHSKLIRLPHWCHQQNRAEPNQTKPKQ